MLLSIVCAHILVLYRRDDRIIIVVDTLEQLVS